MPKKQLIIYLIKLGGSLITDKTKLNSFNPDNVKKLFMDLSKFYNPDKHRLIIGNGAGANTHYLAKKYDTINGIKSKRGIGHCLVKESALRHHSWLNEIGVKANLPLFSFSGSSFLLSEKGKVKNSYFSTLLSCLQNGLVPHVYGDVVFDKTLGLTIFSTEKIFIWLCQNLLKNGFSRINVYFLGDTNGVLDGKKNTIKVLKSSNLNKYRSFVKKSQGFDVTGGMLAKVDSALYLAKLGCQVYIGNGRSFKAKYLTSPQTVKGLTKIVA